MAQKVRDREGQQRPKYEIARDALSGIIKYTGEWKKKHADRLLYLGIYPFSSNVAPVLPMAEFDQAKADAALARIPSPNSGTAIGRALEEGFQALYGSGCVRKYVVCITDGENTSGPPPDLIARQLYGQTKGDVEIPRRERARRRGRRRPTAPDRAGQDLRKAHPGRGGGAGAEEMMVDDSLREPHVAHVSNVRVRNQARWKRAPRQEIASALTTFREKT
jgi:hypothetical protein